MFQKIKKIFESVAVMLMVAATGTHAFQRPPAPSFSGDSVKYDAGTITVTVTPVVAPGFTDLQYHVLLVRDLSISMAVALKEGTESTEGAAASGPVIKKSINQSDLSAGNQIIINISPNAKARYFTAIGLSGNDAAGNRMYSSWKLHTDASGMPKQVSTTRADEVETFYPRAFAVSSTQALFMLQFAVDNPSTCSLKVACGSEVLEIMRLDVLPANEMILATDISQAIDGAKIAGDTSRCMIRPPVVTGMPILHTLFILFTHPAEISTVSYSCIRTASRRKVLAEQKVQISENYGFADMLHTLIALERMPDTTTNPLTFSGTLVPVSDRKEKLISGALLLCALGHNSPYADVNEASQGVFNNYMQFMDTTIKVWGSIVSADSGFERLDRMFGLMCDVNKAGIVDPVYAKNNGTLSDYGKPVKERKNYAFYEGYTRFDATLSFGTSETPSVGPLNPTGTGLLFRISDNISLFEADIADTFSMFDDAFLSGSSTTRRIIISTNDSMMLKFPADGIWVKGNDITQGEKQYYTGIVPVRLPLQVVSSLPPVGTAFKLPTEASGKGDPVGMVVGAERSLMRVYELNATGNSIDTLKNTFDPSTMLHGQSRRFECDPIFLDGSQLSYKLQTNIIDTGKMWLYDSTGYGVTLQDTSTTDNPIKVLLRAIRNIGGKKEAVVVVQTEVNSRKIALQDANNGTLYRTVVVDQVVTVAIEKLESRLLALQDRGDGVQITLTPGIEVYSSPTVSSGTRLFPRTTEEASENTFHTWNLSWSEFEAILSLTNIYIWARKGGSFENMGIGRRVTRNGVQTVDKIEQVQLDVREKYTITFELDDDFAEKTDDYWIPNTQNGFNDKWTISLKDSKNLPVAGIYLQLDYAPAYTGNNQGTILPVFMNASGTEIAGATTGSDGIIRNIRFGFHNNESGRAGNSYRLRARVNGTQTWTDSEEKDYIGVMDKLMLDIARTYCNNATIADWTPLFNNATNTLVITDAVAYVYGGKDAIDCFNQKMLAWQGIMQGVNPAWTVTTAQNNIWSNYYITSGGVVGASPEQWSQIAENCYRPRLTKDDFDIGGNLKLPRSRAGIDCSGLVGRSAGHTILGTLGACRMWNSVPAGDFPANAVTAGQMCEDSRAIFVSGYQGDERIRRIVPGDLLVKPGHVAMVNYIIERRDEREAEHFWIIHATGGKENNPDDPNINGKGKKGMVTDDWKWSGLGLTYNARRLRQ